MNVEGLLEIAGFVYWLHAVIDFSTLWKEPWLESHWWQAGSRSRERFKIDHFYSCWQQLKPIEANALIKHSIETTDKWSSSDHLITMQCSAMKLWILDYFDTYHPLKHFFRTCAPGHGNAIPNGRTHQTTDIITKTHKVPKVFTWPPNASDPDHELTRALCPPSPKGSRASVSLPGAVETLQVMQTTMGSNVSRDTETEGNTSNS